MKTKTSELTGAALNWAVAKCEGEALVDGCLFTKDPDAEQTLYTPSTDWTQGGPIIEQGRICVVYRHFSNIWLAYDDKLTEGWGDTPLIAAMRCFVASRLGDEVEIPEGLV